MGFVFNHGGSTPHPCSIPEMPKHVARFNLTIIHRLFIEEHTVEQVTRDTNRSFYDI